MKSDFIEKEISNLNERTNAGLYESTNSSSEKATDNRAKIVGDGHYENLRIVNVHDEITELSAQNYENTNVSSVEPSNYQTELVGEGHYETLEIANVHDKKDAETGMQDNKLKLLKCVIFIMTVLIIAITILLIFMTLPKAPVDGQWAHWSNLTSYNVTCGKGIYLRTRACTNPTPLNNGKDCTGENLQISQCKDVSCLASVSVFSVTFPHTYSVIHGKYKLNFSRTIYQYGSDFNISTGTYHCRIPGVYLFSATFIMKKANLRDKRIFCHIFKNFAILNTTVEEDIHKKGAAFSQSLKIGLNIGDTVYLSKCNGQPNDILEPW